MEKVIKEVTDESPHNIIINDGIHIVINNNYINESEVKEETHLLKKEQEIDEDESQVKKTIVKPEPVKTHPPTKHIPKKLVREWSKKIRKRDNYTCANCGKTNKTSAQAHHIFPQSRFPELACEEGNGITLCPDCHTDYHQRYQGSENPYNFTRWLNEFKL